MCSPHLAHRVWTLLVPFNVQNMCAGGAGGAGGDNTLRKLIDRTQFLC